MSNYEFNIGRIFPAELCQEDIVEMCISHNCSSMMPTWCDSWDEYFDENSYEMGFVKLNGKWYEILSHHCTEEFESKITVNNDGSIDFLTYHYNGGAFWTEVVAELMRNN